MHCSLILPSPSTGHRFRTRCQHRSSCSTGGSLDTQAPCVQYQSTELQLESVFLERGCYTIHTPNSKTSTRWFQVACRLSETLKASEDLTLRQDLVPIHSKIGDSVICFPPTAIRSMFQELINQYAGPYEKVSKYYIADGNLTPKFTI